MPLDDISIVKHTVKDDFRKSIAGTSFVQRIVTSIYPILLTDHCYMGPGTWEINPLDMTDEATRLFAHDNPSMIEHVNLTEHESYIRVFAYWTPLFAREYAYRLEKKDKTWNITEKRLCGMA